jgi:3-oxo-5alpha-steroid 4-dehydrogenase
MGHAAGGAIDRMDRCCAWRFINPPSAWIRGVLLGPDGSRVCNEELYGSTIGEHLAHEHGGRGVLVIDSRIMETARQQMRTETMGGFQLVFGFLNNYLNHAKAPTLEALAGKCGIPVDAFLRSVEAYNADARRGVDALGKRSGNLQPVEVPPFFAINCDHDTIKFPTPTITLGGLVVDGTSARVVREDGSVIGGLYAAGRNAVGVSSKSYVSGLSVADGIFSGRNAGRSAASRALERAA